jgi:hypothetical protein
MILLSTDKLTFKRSTAMKIKTLSSLAVALVVASLAHAATAETLGDHPAVSVARTWSDRGIDPNTFIVGHPALAASPIEEDEITHE